MWKGIQPPRKTVAEIAQTRNMFTNSARKNIAKRIEAYSVWNPAVSSLSPSTRSKGVRLHSAVEAIP